MVPRTSLRHLQKVTNDKQNLCHLYCPETAKILILPVVDVEEPVQQCIDVGNLQGAASNGSKTFCYSFMVTFHINLEGSELFRIYGHCILPCCIQVIHHPASQALKVWGQLASLSVYLMWKAPVCSLGHGLPPLHLQMSRTLAGPDLLALSLWIGF